MDRSSFSRIIIAVVVALFLLGTFIWRQYQLSQRFEMVGVVEGFYGTPWTHDARLDMVRFLGEIGMNAYIYAPKDDPLHRQRWRDHYDGDQLESFQELVRIAEDAGIDLYYAISPGLSMIYSSDEDYQALKQKLYSLSVLGVRHFALFLDDVPETLQHPEDKIHFPSLGHAHVDLINTLKLDLDAIGASLIVCPTTYTSAWGSREYVNTIGKGVAQDVPMFWTGDDVAIAQITADHAKTWGQLLNRKPLLWDNFPVNDFEQWRPIVGPIRGRSNDLSSATTGLFANPMDNPYLSMIPLYTVAAYARNPYGYDADNAWQQALTHLAGPEGARALRPLLLLFRDYGWTDNVFTPIYTPGKQFNINTVRDALTLFEEQMIILKSDEFKENTFITNVVAELEPFSVQIRHDYDRMINDPYYYPDAEGFLIYQNEREAILVQSALVTLDGNLNEWPSEEFVRLNTSREDDPDRVQIAFRYDRNSLFIAVDVRTNFITSESDTSWIGGDQVLIVLDYTPELNQTWVQPGDLFWLLRPPDEAGKVLQKKGSMVLTPFSQRGISDITMRSISSFFAHYMKPLDHSLIAISESAQAYGRRVSGGYQLELSIPVGSMNQIRANVSVSDVHQLNGNQRITNFIFSRRPYIGNVYTYPEIIFR